jgi:hypothetical protein
MTVPDVQAFQIVQDDKRKRRFESSTFNGTHDCSGRSRQISRITRSKKSWLSFCLEESVENIKCFLLKIIPVVNDVADNSLSDDLRPWGRVSRYQPVARRKKGSGIHIGSIGHRIGR